MELHRGKIARDRSILSVRELVRDDLACLTEKRQVQSHTIRFRDPHHRIARLFASGLRPSDVQARSGYSMSRISTLTQDPAFQELIAKYREDVDATFIEGIDEYYETATSNMLKAEVQIAEKLEAAEEQGETLPMRDLIAISRDAADRFGYGKKQTNLNVNVDFAAQLEKAIKRSGKTIDAKAVSATIAVPPGSSQPRVGVLTSSREPPLRRRA